MDDISKKLVSAGVSPEIIQKLKTSLGNTFETELVTDWLQAAAKKIGLDTTDLPNIDFKSALHAIQELSGKDADGDNKTGISEANAMIL